MTRMLKEGACFAFAALILGSSLAQAQTVGDACTNTGQVQSERGDGTRSGIVCNGTTYEAFQSYTINPQQHGIRTAAPAATLDVNGEVRIGSTAIACSGTNAGAMRYNSGVIEACNGTAWKALSFNDGITPNAFSFTDQTGVTLGTTITSNTVTLSGFTSSTTATCSGCTAIARNGTWGGTTYAGFVSGDTIAIKQTSSATPSTATTATVTVGNTTSGTWTVTTTGSTPSAFSFTDVTDASTSITYSSNAVTLSGFTGSLMATCAGDCVGIAKNGVWGGTSLSGFASGNTIALRMVSAAGTGTATTATATVGTTTSGTWSVTTATACQVGVVIGDSCPDDTIYAGTSPDGSVAMYTTPCDVGYYWDGAACTACGSGLWSGSGTTCSTTYATSKYPTWNNASSNWTDTGYTSATTGNANTAGLAALVDSGSVYKAAKYCDTLTAYGHSDWYLPAKNELNVLYTNRAAIGNFDTTTGGTAVSGAYPGLYWSSSETNLTNAWYQRLSDGNQNYFTKGPQLSARCVRR